MLKMIDTILSCLLLLGWIWAIIGVFYPKSVLWWAAPEKQTRARAFCFAFLSSFIFPTVIIPLQPENPWYLCTIPLFFLYLAFFLKNKFCSRQINTQFSCATADNIVAVTIRSSSGDCEYILIPTQDTCSCPDWLEKRCNAPLHSPYRICKHLATHYKEQSNVIPAPLLPYKSIIFAKAREKRGMPYVSQYTSHEVLNDQAIIIDAQPRSWPWVNVLTGSRCYGFNFDEGRWSYGESPPYEEHILKTISRLCYVSIESIRENSKIHANNFNDYGLSRSEPYEPREITWDDDIKPMLEDALDDVIPDYLQWAQRKAYFILYADDIKKWLCRIHYSASIKFITLPDGNKISVTQDDRVYANSKGRLQKAIRISTQES